MELIFESAKNYISEITENNEYVLKYFEEIANILSCKIDELGTLQLFISSMDENLDNCSIEWFFKQGFNNDNFKEIQITNQYINSLIKNPDNIYETFLMGLETRVINVIDKQGNKQKFIYELHEEKISSKIYCNTNETKIPKFIKTNITIKCENCRKEIKLSVYADDLYHFIYDLDNKRKFIQDYFPYLKPSEREMFMTRICDNCWNKIFPKDE